jgi:hypothetical protein
MSPDYLPGPNPQVLCKRTACRAPVDASKAGWHPHNLAFYCPRCTRDVNEACGELVILSPWMAGWKSPQEWFR